MNLCECGHRSHDTWGCLTPECGCDTPWDRVLVTAAERAERDRLLDRIEALADLLSRFDYLESPDDVPLVVDVPDDYELGIHYAATLLRALVAEERAR